MRSPAGLLLVLGACGRVGFDPTGGDPTTDAVDADPTVDADPASEDADTLAPFGTPVVQTNLGSQRPDQSPSLTADMLEIYFASGRNCGNCSDVYVATRSSVAAPWGTPSELGALANAALDQTPEVSLDGLTLWYSSERENPAGGADIWVTTRADRTQPWSAPMRDENLSTAGYDLDPSLSDDGLTMTLTSDGAGGTAADIYVATRATTTSAWSTPVPLGELNSAARDAAGSLRDSGRRVYLDRETTAGQYDIYEATRESAAAAFGAPALVGVINAPEPDIDAWVSLDLRTIFFASARSGEMEIYAAER